MHYGKLDLLLFCLLLMNCAAAGEPPTDAGDAKSPSRRLAFIPPNPKSSWRAVQSGMCSALPLPGGGYRIWVTGREPTKRPMVIGWMDVDANFKVIDESAEPCLRPEPVDKAGVLMPCVVDAGNGELRMYFTGYRPGLAFSRDFGKTWTKHPDRILEVDDVDPVSLGTNCVVRDGEIWRTFYTAVQPPRYAGELKIDRFLIRYAESSDGLKWTKPKENLALDADPFGTSARPDVWRDGARWLMLYSRAPAVSPEFPVRRYRLRLAESADGRAFRDVVPVLDPTNRAEDFDSMSCEYGWTLPDDRSRFLYSGNGFGRSGLGVARLIDPIRAVEK